MTPPDFEALRAIRNVRILAQHEKFAKEYGLDVGRFKSTFNPNACYCACATHGPCEHKWGGPDWISADGCASSCTCSRCGTTAMSHALRVMP